MGVMVSVMCSPAKMLVVWLAVAMPLVWAAIITSYRASMSGVIVTLLLGMVKVYKRPSAVNAGVIATGVDEAFTTLILLMPSPVFRFMLMVTASPAKRLALGVADTFSVWAATVTVYICSNTGVTVTLAAGMVNS